MAEGNTKGEQTMTRLIDADAIKYTMLYKENWLKGTGVEKQGVWKEDIDAMPTVDAEPVRHGKWEPLTFTNAGNEEYTMHRCSECGLTIVTGWYHYCPNCGARMDKGRKESGR